MSLVYGVGLEPDMIGALSVPRSFAPGKRAGAAAASLARLISSARESFLPPPALPRRAFAKGPSRRLAIAEQEQEIRGAFCRIADVVELAEDEERILCGETHELSRVILALETLTAALDLFAAPQAVLAHLRAENPEEPFNGRAPLQAMAADGRLGVEITLLYLRGRLRLAQRDDKSDGLLALRPTKWRHWL